MIDKKTSKIKRLQPPENQQRFNGQIATQEIVDEYIGKHIAILEDGKKVTIDEFLNDNPEITGKYLHGFLSLFPYQIEDLADMYWKKRFNYVD